MALSKSDPIVIVGAGAFGLSSALRLLEAGFDDITVLDKDDSVPSRFSAANDINKIVRAEYEDPFYTQLALDAIEAWKTPLFAPHFHQTGFLHCISGSATDRAAATLNRFRGAAEVDPRIKSYVVPINGPKDIQRYTWQYEGAPLPGWSGYLNQLDGYAHSGNALRAVYAVARDRGVKFFLGASGDVSEILYATAPDGQRKATGVKTKTSVFNGAAIIVAAGAAAARLVPECGKQVVAKSWSVAHIQLTDDEVSALRGIPVTYARDLGFFFEPDPKTNLLKLCPMGGGYVNTDPASGVSHAPASVAQSNFMPWHDQQKLRRLLQHTLPHLADRPLVKQSLCWFADTSDSDFIIDYVPNTSSSLIIMTGDSGHAFKMYPIAGNWVRDLVLAPDGKQPTERFRWKTPPEPKEGEDWGETVSWRLGDVQELKDLERPTSSKL